MVGFARVGGLGLKVGVSKLLYIMGASDNDSLPGSSPGGGGLIPPEPIFIFNQN